MGVERSFAEKMNRLGKAGVPFLFLTDFDMKRPVIQPLASINPEEILYDMNGKSNVTTPAIPLPSSIIFDKIPVALAAYRQAFERVMYHLQAGNSFLVNLTFPTEVHTNLSLRQIFFHSRAKYKLWFQDTFVVFSPETFITIEGGVISSRPMKGTINASIPDAENILLNDPKELAEHITIVDLIRNDMSRIASQVHVPAFRYVDRITAHDKELLQVSSHITGRLPGDYQSHLGDILLSMLPAGSVSGAPKPKTLDIIHETEQYQRGYYTGVTGLFDGEKLDCGVMIRFLEKQEGKLFFKSGGGITANSQLLNEYHELIDKVYVPLHRVYQTS